MRVKGVRKMSEYTKEEDKILAKYYPNIGSKVQMYLVGRSLDSIDHRCRRLGIKYNPLGEGKVGFLDIETSGLQGDFNFMYSWCIKVAGEEKIYSSCITSEEMKNGMLDYRVVNELIMTLPEFKRVYTFYGTRFDVPFSRTRALYHGLEFVPYGLVEHKDVYYLARRVLKIHRNRLETVADLLGIKGKTHLDPRLWVQANCGNEEALGYILDHNIHDVVLLEQVYRKLMEYEARTRRYL
jgi:uncharacterized protein YprB with RNaseH-like and TPR domain